MTKYRPRSAASLRLRLFEYAVKSDTYVEVLSVLAQGIKAAAARIEQAGKSGSAEFAEAVAEAEVEIIEGLIGAACIVCQTQITAITQAALACRAQAIRDGLPFPAFGDKDHDVRRFGPPFDAHWTKIEILWGLANYFKHRDEWSRATWISPQDLARHTVPVISAAGLRQGSNGNLRTGAEALGNVTYASLNVFHEIIYDWANQVRNAIRKAVGL